MKKYKHLSAKERKQIIVKHFEKRISQARLAIEFDTNRTTVSRLCRNYGRSPRLTNYNLDDKEIVRLYTEEKKSALQIATLLGITPRPVKRRLRLAGVLKKVSKRKIWEKEIPYYGFKMKIWTGQVIGRDEMKCKWCKSEYSEENRLVANHIIPVRDLEMPDLVFDINNGITLCQKCHYKIHYHEKEYETFFLNLIRTRSSV